MYYEQHKNVLPLLGPIPMLGYWRGRCRRKWSFRCWRVVSRISWTPKSAGPNSAKGDSLAAEKGLPTTSGDWGRRKRSLFWGLLLRRSLFCRSRPWLYGRWSPHQRGRAQRLLFLLRLRRNRSGGSSFPMTHRSFQQLQPPWLLGLRLLPRLLPGFLRRPSLRSLCSRSRLSYQLRR